MLKVTVSSFSYRKGIPEDPTENGGGFVFDCRGLHNPGRYDEYKALCGLDAPVIEFLKKEPDVDRFLESVATLMDISIESYLRRDYSHLMVSFGCTGGQHRSVYCAQYIGTLLKEKYPQVEVVIIHREQQNK